MSMSLSTPTPGIDRDKLYRKIGWRVLPLLFLAYVIANLDRSNVAFAKLQFLPALGFTERDYGLGATFFYVGYVICEIPSNLLVLRIGVKATFIRIMTLWFIFSLASILISSSWHFYVLRALLGAAEAGFLPGALLYLSRWIPSARRARFTALLMSAIPLSGFIGGPLAGAVMQWLDGVGGMAGWRWLFVMTSVPAALLALVVYIKLVERPSEASWLSVAERDAMKVDLASAGNETSLRSSKPLFSDRSNALAAFRNPWFYLIGVQSFAMLMGLNALNLWGPTILKRAGIGDILRIGLMSSLPQAAGVVALFLGAHLSDRAGERRWHVAVPSLLAATGWLLLPMADGLPFVSLGLLTIISIGLFGATAPFWSIPSQYIGGKAAAAGIALVTTMGALGAMTGSFLVGWLADRTGSLDAGQLFYGVISVVGAISLLVGTNRLTLVQRVAAVSVAGA